VPATIRVALGLVVVATIFTLACLTSTTAMSMTLFFMLGLPLYSIAMLLYFVEVLRDLRRHDVL
jgi:hypothetical protein